MEPQRTFTPHGAPIRDAKLLPIQPPVKVIGRNHELGSMHVTLKIGSAVFLSGPSGIGKTALASVLATAYIASSPGGVLWFNVVEDEFNLLVARTGRAYGINALTMADTEEPDRTRSDNMGVIRALLEKNRPLIVLDGLIDIDAARDYVRQCAPSIPVIIINETSGAGPWTPIELGPLTQPDSAELYKQCSNLNGPLFDADIEGLVKFLGGIPMAIELAGRQVVTDDLMPAELLSDMPSNTGQDGQLVIMAIVFKRLPPAVQAMLLVLSSMFTGSATAELISDLSDVPANNIIPLMRQLVVRGLARESVVYGQFAYTLHEVAQTYARDWLEQYKRLQGTETRALQAVVKYAERHAANQPLHHDRLAAEMDNIVGAAAYATSTNQSALFRRLVHVLTQRSGDFVTARGFQPEMTALMKLATLLGPSAEEVRAQPGVTSTQQMKAVAPPSAPPAEEPDRFLEPEETFDFLKDLEPFDVPEAEATAPIVSTDETQRTEPALDSDDITLKTTQTMPVDETQIMKPIHETQEAPEAESNVTKPTAAPSPVIPEPPRDKEMTPVIPAPPRSPVPPPPPSAPRPRMMLDETQPSTLEQLLPPDLRPTPLSEVFPDTAAPPMPTSVPEASAEPVIPEPAETPEDTDVPTDHSLPTLQKQLADAQNRGDQATQARLLQTLGQYATEQNDRTEAMNYYKQALEAFEAVEDSDGIVATLDSLATLSAQADNADDAVLYATRGVNIAQQLGDRTRLGRLQTRLGDVRLALGELPGAVDAYTQAIEALRASEDAPSVGIVLSKLGGAYLEQHKPKDAITTLEQALAIFQQEQQGDQTVRVLLDIGAAYGELQQWDQAQNYADQALPLIRQNEDRAGEGQALLVLARARRMQSDRAGAVTNYRRALYLAYQTDDTDSQAEIAFELGNLLSDDMNTLSLALQLLRESDAQVPNGEARRMVERARKRLERATAAGVNVPPIAVSSQEYAAEAYKAVAE